MNRKQQLENIIIGTLMESNTERNYYDDCRNIITSDMFADADNRRIYGIIAEMNARGIVCTDPCSIFTAYGAEVMDIVAVMADRMAEYSFIHLKCQHNERQYLASLIYDTKPVYTDVRFSDYVLAFIKAYEYERKEREGSERAAAHAA